MAAPASRRCASASQHRCCRPIRRKASIPSPAWSALSPAACRAAARSSSILPAWSSKFSTPIRAASSACACADCARLPRRRRPMSDAPIGLALRASGPLAPLQRCALWLAELSGWRRAGMAMMLGALAALTLPPIDLTPLLLVAFSGLVWLADGATGRRAAFALGWNFGFGFFLVGLYWITAALFVDIAQFWWLVPIALLGTPAGFAL